LPLGRPANDSEPDAWALTLVPLFLTSIVAILPAQGRSDSLLAAEREQLVRLARDREIYQMGRSCTADSSRLFREARSREASDAAAIFAGRLADSARRQLVLNGCRDALMLLPDRYAAAQTAIQTRIVAAAEARRSRFQVPQVAAFGKYSWVFYADLVLGLVLGLVAAHFRYRDQPAGARGFAMGLLGLLGLCLGGAIFVPLLFMSQVLLFLHPPEPPAVFLMSVIAVVWVVLSIVAGTAARKRRNQWMP
jgi:uncharacterized membrane protein YeaQ/YmgE (transglycosylase-associated protein family)